MKNLESLFLSATVGTFTLGLMACGDDVTTTEQIYNTVAGSTSVETKKDLPDCNTDETGHTVYVKDSSQFYGCDGKNWTLLNGNSINIGENFCSSVELKDESGFKIVCNDVVIGTVYNGKDGEVVTDSVTVGNENSCVIKKKTEQDVTIACGSETFKLDLAGTISSSSQEAESSSSEECDENDIDGCTESVDSGDDVGLSGQSQKGPFVRGVDVFAYELKDGKTLKQTGNNVSGKIEREDGLFNIKSVKLASQYAYLVADGFYYNEVTGKQSDVSLKLRALANLKRKNTANINLITHIEFNRVEDLVTGKTQMKVMDAKRQAEKEIFAAFSINSEKFKNNSNLYAEDYNILSEGDGNAALLAISILLQGDRSVPQLTALLASLSIDLGDDGIWGNLSDRANIADWAMEQSLSKEGLDKFRNNILGWKIKDAKVPAFETYFNNFWESELNLPHCGLDKDGKMQNAGLIKGIANTYSKYYAKNDSVYNEGIDKSSMRLYCDEKIKGWRIATENEKNTFGLEKIANAAYRGMFDSTKIYVYENKAWRIGTELDLDEKLGSCTQSSLYSVKQNSGEEKDNWYTCANDVEEEINGVKTPTRWRKSKNIEIDTLGWGWGKDFTPSDPKDSVRTGEYNANFVYVYEDYAYRVGSEMDLQLGACTKEKASIVTNTSVGTLKQIRKTAGSKYYKCIDVDTTINGASVPRIWKEASLAEVETFGWNSGDRDGRCKKSTSENTYVYDQFLNQWNAPKQHDCTTFNYGCTTNRYGFLDAVTTKTSLAYRCTAEGWTALDENSMENDLFPAEANKDGTTKVYFFCSSSDAEVYDYRRINKTDEDKLNSLAKYGCVKDAIVGGDYEPEFALRDGAEFTKKAGELIRGRITGNLYVNENGEFRKATDLESFIGYGCTMHNQTPDGELYALPETDFLCQESGWEHAYGTLNTQREGEQEYRTIRVYGNTWMAENMNYRVVQKTDLDDSLSFCYSNNPSYCELYGRLYSWSTAADSANNISKEGTCGYGGTCSSNQTIQGLCPTGWHIPTKADVNDLITYQSGNSVRNLLATPVGKDYFGLGLERSGFRTHWSRGTLYSSPTFTDESTAGYFWIVNSGAIDKNDDRFRTLNYVRFNTESLGYSSLREGYTWPTQEWFLAVPLRCVKD